MTLPRGITNLVYLPPDIQKEFDEALPILAGSPSAGSRRVQERLVLAGYNVAIDGAFGPATTKQLMYFQKANGMPETGVYDVLEHDFLCSCFINATNNATILDGELPSAIISIAKQHISSSPREVGGQNRGPWVRLYMDGHDGPAYLWCAGFCFFIIAQALSHLKAAPLMQKTFSVDVIVERAKNAGLFVNGDVLRKNLDRHQIPPGSLFVVRSASHSWSHVGIVGKHEGDVIYTFEGNTNDDGSSNGYEAIERVRNLTDKDFVIWR